MRGCVLQVKITYYSTRNIRKRPVSLRPPPFGMKPRNALGPEGKATDDTMKRILEFGVRARILIVAVVAIVPAIAIVTFDTIRERRTAIVKAVEGLEITAGVFAADFERIVASMTEFLRVGTAHPIIKTAAASVDCNRVLMQVAAVKPEMSEIAIADPFGTIYCASSAPLLGIKVGDNPLFLQAVDSASLAYSTASVFPKRDGASDAADRPTFALGIKDDTGAVIGVALATVDPMWLRRIGDRIPVAADVTVLILDQSGEPLATFPASRTASALVGHWRREIGSFMADDDGLTTPASAAAEERWFHSLKTVSVSPSASIFVIAARDKKGVLAPANREFILSISLAGILAAAALALAWLTGERLIGGRLLALGGAAQKIADGQLSARSGVAGHDDDIGRLAQRFDAMASAIEARENELRAALTENIRATRALQTLSASNRTLLAATDERKLLQDMCNIVVGVGDYRAAYIGFAQNDSAKSIRPVAMAGLDQAYFDEVHPSWSATTPIPTAAGTAILTGRPKIAQDVSTDHDSAPWRDVLGKRGFGAVLAMPLLVDEVAIGVIVIFATEANAFGGRERHVLEELSMDLAFGISTIRDRAKGRAAEEMVRDLAYRDPVTDLPNRAKFQEILGRTIQDANTANVPFAVLSIGFPNYGEIVDTLGIDSGVRVQQVSAPRIRQVLRAQDSVARSHGDHFWVLLQGATGEIATRAARAIEKAFDEHLKIDNVTVYLESVIGIAAYPEHGDNADELLRHADVAMRQAAREQRPRAVYDPVVDRIGTEHLRMAGELRRAIDSGQLILFGQPKVDLATHRTTGVEMLVRWRHPDRGMIPPDRFIGIAERTGLIRPLTNWVVQAAFRESHAWQASGLPVDIAVNLSARNLLDPNFADDIGRMLEAWRLNPALLGFEITESAIMDDPTKALSTLDRLRTMGLNLFVDDYGTGYSSLGYLKSLPVDAIKIDKSFVFDIEKDADSIAIVRSTIELAHNLGKRVIAEGVENENVMATLIELGCDVAQGYHIARPTPLDELRTWMQTSEWKVDPGAQAPATDRRPRQGTL